MATGKILATAFSSGAVHDFRLFKESGLKLPPHVPLLADAGYQGVAKIHLNSRTPAKKTKLHPLNKEQQLANRILSRQRIVIEHIFRKLKVFRMLSERYRNRRRRFRLRFNLIALIYNMELKIVGV